VLLALIKLSICEIPEEMDAIDESLQNLKKPKLDPSTDYMLVFNICVKRTIDLVL